MFSALIMKLLEIFEEDCEVSVRPSGFSSIEMIFD